MRNKSANQIADELVPDSQVENVKKTAIDRPPFLKDEHLEYLDYLSKSGITNMHKAAPGLHEDFPELSEQEARSVLKYWWDKADW